MNDVQIRAIAAGFIHAMQTTPELFTEWNQMDKTPANIGPLIQRTLNLATVPTADDLTKLAAYVDEHLSDQFAQLRAAHPEIHPHCGNTVGVNQP
jgi:hypothetical protein